jgi:hypothetical protein
MSRFWWLRPTRAGRFYARHRDCKIASSNGSNWCGYYTIWECKEFGKPWGHSQHRYGVSYPELGIPSWYSRDPW